MAAITPFSLLGSRDPRTVRAEVAILCQVQESQVQDVYPCTPLQEGMLAATARTSDDYIAHFMYDIRDDVCVDKLHQAWQEVARANTILRTRIVSLRGLGLVQAVIDEPLEWATSTCDDTESDSQGTASTSLMGLGTSLARFTVDTRSSCLRLDIHHALYDGWSLPLLLKEAECAYHGEPSQCLQPMTHLIKHQLSQDDSSTREFWQSQFSEIQGAHFPPPKPTGYTPSAVTSLFQTIAMPSGERCQDFTTATIIKAAWSLVVAEITGRSEALFGLTVSGRQAPIDGIENVAGPAIATVPVRVSVDWEQDAAGLLRAVQNQATDMIPFEQTGLQRIRRSSQDAALACNFQTLLVIQPAKKDSEEGPPSPTSLLEDASSSNSQVNDTEHFQTYPLVVECELGSTELYARFDFDPAVLSEERVNTGIKAFERTFQKLSLNANLTQTLRGIVTDAGTQAGIERIWSWNAICPEATEKCIHHLICRHAQETPDALAICSWDGELSYAQLDQLSNRLAFSLVARKVQNSVVPLLFEKSRWMPVAVLAVLKAGAAPVAVDISQPSQRLQTIISQADSSVVLCSGHARGIAAEVSAPGAAVVIVDHAFFQQVEATCELPDVSPHDKLYVVFTSGSTGTPKGVIVTHRNFATAITYQRKYLGLGPKSRALDFASYAFDVAWSNLFNTLTAGGCLCIPSTHERQNDLPGCLKKYQINYLDLTPSVARALGRDALRQLDRLILGGEAAQKEDAFLANDTTQVFNLYGPAECTPTITCARLDGTSTSIGRGEGVCTWLVQPDNPDQLAPLGDVGELWVEGPLVGAGYLNSPEQTRAAFVDDPPWLLDGLPERDGRPAILGRRGRLYRTGDLVRYNQDGTLDFVGRKDDQLKIRGQRIELGEVEAYIREALDSFQGPISTNIRVIVDAIKPAGVKNAVLVAFLSEKQERQTLNEESHTKAVQAFVPDLTERLANMLPTYMRPSSFIPVLNMPVTTNGKADRKALREYAETKWVELRDAADEQEAKDEELSEVEQIIQQVWMSVLNLPAARVPVNKAFMRMGGDSISAMQVVSECRLRSVVVTVGDVLQAGTIRNLASRCQISAKDTTEVDESEEHESDGPFLLSPIQKNFFDSLGPLNHYNQSFALEMRTDVTSDNLRNALLSLVSRHAMLRARFSQRDDKSWEQYIAADDTSSFGYQEHAITTEDEFVLGAQRRQENLDIVAGPVFAGDMFYFPSGKRKLVLSAHHLVVDLVSWRVIWADIEDWTESGKLPSSPTTSFRKWCKRQAQVASSASPLSVLPYAVPKDRLEYWGLSITENNYGGVSSFGAEFDTSTTEAIFGAANDSIRTEPTDIILGALAHAFMQTFPDRSLPAIWIEGHGREPLGDLPIDVSRTVGWFTTILPVSFDLTQHDCVTHAVRLTKDIRRKVPGKGQPYFACRYHSESGCEAFKLHGNVVEIQFNFTGRFQQLEKDEGLFKTSESEGEGDSELQIVPVAPSAPRSAMIDITAGVENGCLQVTFEVHNDMAHQDRLDRWGNCFHTTLKSVVEGLASSPPTFSLADFPLLSLSYEGLDMLLGDQLAELGIASGDITDIYPCSPLQEGMLLSQAKGSASYSTYSIWDCIDINKGDSAVCPVRLAEAWKVVASRHPILSTVFLLHPESHGFVQVVLKTPETPITQMTTSHESSFGALANMSSAVYTPGQLEHCFTICQSHSGHVACRLDASHAIYDAASQGTLLEELAAAYDGLALPRVTSFQQVIEYIETTPRLQRMAQWAKLLEGVSPCEFPISVEPSEGGASHFSMPALQGLGPDTLSFCKEMEITHSTFFQVAWAMTLSHFTGMHDVCFGSLSSGRDIPVQGIENIVGPVATMLICRVNLRNSLRKVLKETLDNSIQSMAIQHSSLADIQHKLGLTDRKLFNTSLSIQRVKVQEDSKQTRSLHLETRDADDAHEDDLNLSIGIGEEDLDATLNFHQGHVSMSLAEEVCHVLHQAVKLLLESRATKPVGTLFQQLFKHFNGTDEDSATSFWQNQFAGTEGTVFPPPQKPAAKHPTTVDTTRQIEIRVQGHTQQPDRPPLSTLMKTACAILVARSMNIDEALFGTSFPDNSNVLPLRISLDWQSTIAQTLKQIEIQAAEMGKFTKTDIRYIRRMGAEASLACDFRTLLREVHECDAVLLDHGGNEIIENRPQFPLQIEHQPIEDGSGAVVIRAQYKALSLTEVEVSRMLNQLAHVYQQLCKPDLRHQKLGQITLTSHQDLQDIWKWNSSVPTAAETCLHGLISGVVSRYNKYGDAAAIHAWDGVVTYSQLEQMSTSLAHILIQRGVRIGDVVPLCFEKSKWTTIAALAVMKSGGVCLLIDPSTQPEGRIKSVCTRTEAKLMVASAACENLAHQVGIEAIIVEDAIFLEPQDQNASLPVVKPSDALYIMFTSGSTGQPKGITITHRNACSAILHQKDILGFSSSSRVLDFASYAFDACWWNLTNTLGAGGCLCVPSAEERDNIAHCIEKYNITAVDLIPSVARSIEPKFALSRLSSLYLAGEAVLPNDAELGGDHVQVWNVYGPAECTPTSTFQNISRPSKTGIGRGAGLCTWVIEPDNINRLAAIGGVGELCLEGPLVGEGYIHDTERTAAAFVEDPPWLVNGANGAKSGRRGRIYRTGDLVRYNPDGSLEFLDRKDSQVKVRGQRLELGEVEQHVRRAIEDTSGLPGVSVVAEVVKIGASKAKSLVAFVTQASDNDSHTQDVREVTAGLSTKLETSIPQWMIPTAYIPIEKVPHTTSGKVDRRKLQDHAASIRQEDLATSQGSAGPKRQPKTETERLLQDLWVDVLGLNEGDVSADDSFFRLGGDSIGAMQLVMKARQKGVVLSVREIFQNPLLVDLAALLAARTQGCRN